MLFPVLFSVSNGRLTVLCVYVSILCESIMCVHVEVYYVCVCESIMCVHVEVYYVCVCESIILCVCM